MPNVQNPYEMCRSLLSFRCALHPLLVGDVSPPSQTRDCRIHILFAYYTTAYQMRPLDNFSFLCIMRFRIRRVVFFLRQEIEDLSTQPDIRHRKSVAVSQSGEVIVKRLSKLLCKRYVRYAPTGKKGLYVWPGKTTCLVILKLNFFFFDKRRNFWTLVTFLFCCRCWFSDF